MNWTDMLRGGWRWTWSGLMLLALVTSARAQDGPSFDDPPEPTATESTPSLSAPRGAVGRMVPVEPAALEQGGTEPEVSDQGIQGGGEVGIDSGVQGLAEDAEELYPVSKIVFTIDPEHPGLPTAEDLGAVEVALVLDGKVLAVPQPGEQVPALRIDQIGDQGTVLMTRAGITELLNRIGGEFERRHLLGYIAFVSPQDILLEQPEGYEGLTDFRGDRTELNIFVLNGVVTNVRTVASGSRFGIDERLNNPAHVRILQRSPIGVVPNGEYTDDNNQRDLLRRDLLDDYVLRLNRFPGRRVDVALAPGEQAGEVTLDYLVSENKQWLAYMQLSNTGTKSTEIWRERFGAQFTQLANLDDILSVEYITAGFSSSHAAIASYEMAIPRTDRWRGKVFGDFSKFTASDVGLADERFTGESFTVGGELAWNFYQREELFVDAFAGVRWNQTEVFNEAVGVQGREHFLVPKIGLRAEAATDKWSFNAQTTYEWSLADLAGGKSPGLERLGRLAPTQDWEVFRYAVSGSFFLEPLILGSDWEDPSTWKSSTLAHEIALSVRGQYAIDNRLVPNEQQVVGGLYSVRGYPESVVAGDNVVIASAEYRWHLPRSFRPMSVPDASGALREPGSVFGRPFYGSPRTVYGRPDWDLVLKAFTDIGRSQNVDKQAFEKNEDLWGAGLGVDLLFYRNVSVRVDWAVALDDVDNQSVKSGSNRFHLVFTLLF